MTRPDESNPERAANTPNPWGDRDWTEYYDAVAGKPPRDTTLKAVEVVGPDAPRVAIDIGAGDGRDTAVLLAAGFEVLSADPHPDSLRRITERVMSMPQDAARRLHVVTGSAESLDAAIAMRPQFASCGIVNASFSLPFVKPDRYARAWSMVRNTLAPGGVFAGQIFGDRDTWATNPTRSHHTREQALQLLEGLEIVQFTEDEKDGHDSVGVPKHWHVFHVVARRPK